jgi:hypothetical protein
MRKSVGQAPTAERANKHTKKSVGQAPTAERANKRKKKSVGRHPTLEQNGKIMKVGRGPTKDRKGLNVHLEYPRKAPKSVTNDYAQDVILWTAISNSNILPQIDILALMSLS